MSSIPDGEVSLEEREEEEELKVVLFTSTPLGRTSNCKQVMIQR